MNDDVRPTGPPPDLTAVLAGIERTNELLTRVLAEVATTPSTHAAFVDAGYVYAAAGRLVAGTEDRRAFELDAEGLIEAFIDKARTIFPDSRLLRVYWYDGARRRIHTAEQQRVAELPDVKVRLGNLNANNQQKGVDSLIRSDLESLARHRAISDAVLIGGDEDLVSAVEAAQGYGARVHLWGIEAVGGRNQAEPLLWEVDSQRTFDLEFCKPYVTRRAVAFEGGDPAADGSGGLLPTRDEVRFVGAQVAARWLAERGAPWVTELLPGHPYLPGAVDQELLTAAEALLGHSLRGHADLRRALRDGFWERVRAQG
ncbi:NYN domain-containing protein [Streptomyces sp. WAC 06725]|uniref:NYN domain-containing protein n=1 Tax=Streptomyces sp. WAC 06725 TaxID=2203209 RepID=UPI000F747C09|nr:NYN domain-containing protein [Streptomyces sp. WAC 06725]RSO42072.1 NYN domain-containing protein [Streptomyces sp. WAC 06725]